MKSNVFTTINTDCHCEAETEFCANGCAGSGDGARAFEFEAMRAFAGSLALNVQSISNRNEAAPETRRRHVIRGTIRILYSRLVPTGRTSSVAAAAACEHAQGGDAQHARRFRNNGGIDCENAVAGAAGDVVAADRTRGAPNSAPLAKTEIRIDTPMRCIMLA